LFVGTAYTTRRWGWLLFNYLGNLISYEKVVDIHCHTVCCAHMWKVAPWWWLWWVAKTCRSKKNCCAVIGNENSYQTKPFTRTLGSTMWWKSRAWTPKVWS
jgi:hypothetical protein